MCGRFQLNLSKEELVKNYSYINFHSMDNNYKVGEQFPGDEIIAIDQGLNLIKGKWGFPLSNKLIINARAETLLEKTLFKNSIFYKRCIVPASYYYEWDKEKKNNIKYKVYLEGAESFSMAALYQQFTNRQGELYRAIVIITREAEEEIKRIHPRMPFVLNKEEERYWIKETIEEQEVMKFLEPRPLRLNLLEDKGFEQMTLI